MLVVPAIDRLFTDFGYTIMLTFTGPLPGVTGIVYRLVPPVALLLGLLVMVALSWFVVARRGAPWLLWLVPLGYSLVRAAGFGVEAYIRWRMWHSGTGMIDSAALSEWFREQLTSWPYMMPQVYVGALVGYPLAALLGSWLGKRNAARITSESQDGHA